MEGKRCALQSRLSDLPAPPPGKSGWPWTEETPPLPPLMTDGLPWPRISVVTPSYNQGAFLEETIRSVLLQGYPDLDYLIIDGGSTDDSVLIIEKYAPWLSFWTSEPDRGQAHAINKGLALCDGAIFNWVNSDDVLTPGALRTVAEAMGANDAVAGPVLSFDAAGRQRLLYNRRITARNLSGKRHGVALSQPGVWVRPEAVRRLGGIDESFTCAFDAELLFRYVFHYPRIAYVDEVLIRFRLHPESKTMARSAVFRRENIAILRNLLRRPEYGPLKPHMRRRLKRLFWRRHLDKLLSAGDIPPLRKLRIITAGALVRPRTAFASVTVKAIKAVIRQR